MTIKNNVRFLKTIIAIALTTPSLAFTMDTIGTQLEEAKIVDTSLKCSVAPTEEKVEGGEHRFYLSKLTVNGMSSQPRVMDKATGEWMKISQEPLFVFTPNSSGSAETKDLKVSVFTKQFNTPFVTNMYAGSSAIGSVDDMPFQTELSLEILMTDTNGKFIRTILVNDIEACKLKFDFTTRAWSVVKR